MSNQRSPLLAFPPFLLDPGDERLWRGNDPIVLKPKAFAVLRYLAERPQRLITKDELLNHFWSDVFVGDAVLKTQMAEIRRALGDDIKAPRFIATAHRRGYRFIANVEVVTPSQAVDAPAVSHAIAIAAAKAATAVPASTPSRQRTGRSPICVGRERELQRLSGSLSRALQGQPQAVFLTGAAGAGKTTLASEFLARLEGRDDLWLARGQCIGAAGASEAYLPVLEALGRLCRQPGKERILEVLRKFAPSWLLQLQGVLDGAELSALEASAHATPASMLRQIADAVLSLAEERGLVLLFEDLHWADAATLHLISYLARRSDPARVLLIGTCRPHAVPDQDHPLVSIEQDLQVSGRGEEIALLPLGDGALSEYLEVRFPGHHFPSCLVQVLRERTSGDALVLSRVVDDWLERRWLVEHAGTWQLAVEVEELVRGVPASLSRMIERELERLPEFERGVLQAASVVGVEFSVRNVAAALKAEVAKTEELCSSWARKGQFLRALGTSQGPDGSMSLRCAFAHGLYQQVAYEGVLPSRRAQLHLRAGMAGNVRGVPAAHGAAA